MMMMMMMVMMVMVIVMMVVMMMVVMVMMVMVIVMMVVMMMVVMVMIALLLCISGVSCTFFRFECFPPQEWAGLDKATRSSCRKGLGGCLVNQSIELHFTC